MALYHQYYICKSPNIASDIIVSATSSQFSNSVEFQNYKNILKNVTVNIDSILAHKFATFNNIEYRPGSLIIENDKISEIVHILSHDSHLIFICEPQKVLRTNYVCNSLVLEKIDDKAFVLYFKSFEEKITYDKIHSHGEFHVVLSNLSFKNIQ